VFAIAGHDTRTPPIVPLTKTGVPFARIPFDPIVDLHGSGRGIGAGQLGEPHTKMICAPSEISMKSAALMIPSTLE